MFRHRISFIFSILLFATAISWEFGHLTFFNEKRYAGITVICIAFIKVRLVALEFMELRHAPVFMRVSFELWVFILCSHLCNSYWNQA